MDAHFTTGGVGARDLVKDAIARIVELPPERSVCVHIMAFSFTDQTIACALVGLAMSHPRVRIRLIADWGQRNHFPSVIPRMIQTAPPNLEVRFTRDQPYLWHIRRGRVQWSYDVSLGFLHHKTLLVLVDGEPFSLVCGSSNWTKNAEKSYENILTLSAESAAEADIIVRFELEFEALWTDGRETLSPAEAEQHDAMLRQQIKAEPHRDPRSIEGLDRGTGGWLEGLARHFPVDCGIPVMATEGLLASGIAVAFSARPKGAHQQFGYAERNRSRRFPLVGPSGRTKFRPFSLTSLALSLIFKAAPGQALWIAMYGISPRVAEFGALLDAARRRVRLRVLLDRRIGGQMAARLHWISRHEDLPIEVRTCERTMHQKYVLHPDSDSVLTGTANMSTDSSLRHTEHRMLISGDTTLSRAFARDFECMWTAERQAR